jgi:predicted RNA binding protein YcfA (HicA-like mRNA interferase family)
VKRVDLIRYLEQHGCLLHREGGNHSIYVNPQTRRGSAVPRHREIKEPVVAKICRDLDIPKPN